MDKKSIELYQEEQLQLLKNLQSTINGLTEALTGKIAINVTNPDEVKVTGAVEVNTEKEVEITNIGEFVDGLKEMDSKIAAAIEATKQHGTQSVTVENIKDAIASEFKISNLGELAKSFDELKDAIASNKAVVNVTEKTIAWPTLAKDAIPVRLSDGKSFYKAVAAAFAGGVSASLATDIATAMGVGGISLYTYIQKDTTSDTVNYKYYGYMKADGAWTIKRVNRTTNLAEFYIGASNYTTNWGNRASLTPYGSYSDIF